MKDTRMSAGEFARRSGIPRSTITAGISTLRNMGNITHEALERGELRPTEAQHIARIKDRKRQEEVAIG